MTVEQLIEALLLIEDKQNDVEFSDQHWVLNGETVESVYEEYGKVKIGN